MMNRVVGGGGIVPFHPRGVPISLGVSFVNVIAALDSAVVVEGGDFCDFVILTNKG